MAAASRESEALSEMVRRGLGSLVETGSLTPEQLAELRGMLEEKKVDRIASTSNHNSKAARGDRSMELVNIFVHESGWRTVIATGEKKKFEPEVGGNDNIEYLTVRFRCRSNQIPNLQRPKYKLPAEHAIVGEYLNISKAKADHQRHLRQVRDEYGMIDVRSVK
jgi:hypothetical protein